MPPKSGHWKWKPFLKHQPFNTCFAGCWVQFPDDAAYALNNYCRSCTVLLDIFHVFIYMKKINSCNLYLAFCRLHWELNSGMKGLRNKCYRLMMLDDGQDTLQPYWVLMIHAWYNKPQSRWKGIVLLPDFSLSTGVMHLLTSWCGQHTYTIIMVLEKS
jgi:hypothetical protein